MQVEESIPGVYTCSRALQDDQTYVLVAEDPIMHIKRVEVDLEDGVAVSAEVVFEYLNQRESITFFMEPNVLPAEVTNGLLGIISSFAPGIVQSLTDGVTATPIDD